MPGVHDDHVHAGLSDPASMLAGGMTSGRDLGWPLDRITGLVDDIRTGRRSGPELAFAGPMLTAVGGYPTSAEWAPSGTGRELSSAADAAAAVVEHVAAGATSVKIAINADAGPTPSMDVLRAVVGAARGAGVQTVAHCQGPGQVARALESGVQELAHAPWSERLSDDLITALARRMRIVSTLDIHGWGEETEAGDIARENLARFLRAGGRVSYGTDLGNGEVPPGISVREMLALTRCGLVGDDLLVASTRSGLTPGAPADIVVLNDDPRPDPEAFGRITHVYRGGSRVA